MRHVFLIARRPAIVGEGAAALQVAALESARLRFCDLAILHCVVRLDLCRLGARSRREHDWAG